MSLQRTAHSETDSLSAVPEQVLTEIAVATNSEPNISNQRCPEFLFGSQNIDFAIPAYITENEPYQSLVQSNVERSNRPTAIDQRTLNSVTISSPMSLSHENQSSIHPAVLHSQNSISQTHLKQSHNNHGLPLFASAQEMLAQTFEGVDNIEQMKNPQCNSKNTALNMEIARHLSTSQTSQASESSHVTDIKTSRPMFCQKRSDLSLSIDNLSIEIEQTKPAIQTFQNISNQRFCLSSHSNEVQAENRPPSSQVPCNQVILAPRSTLQMSMDPPINSRQLPEHLPNKHPPNNNDVLEPKLCITNVISTETTGVSYIDDKLPPQTVRNKALLGVNVDNHSCGSLECSCNDNFSSALKDILLNDMPLQKTVIRRATGKNPLDLKAPFEVHTLNRTSAKPSALANQLSHALECSNNGVKLAPVYGDCLQQDQQTQGILLNKSMNTNAVHQTEYQAIIPQNILKSVLSSNSKNRFCYLSVFHGKHSSTTASTHSLHNPHKKETFEWTSAETGPQNSPISVNQSLQSSIEEPHPTDNVSGSGQQKSSIEQIHVGMLFDESATKPRNHKENIKHEPLMFVQTLPNSLNEMWLNFRNIAVNIQENNVSEANYLETFTLEYDSCHKILEKVVTMIDHYCEIINDNALAFTPKNISDQIKNVNAENLKRKNNDCDDGNGYIDHKPPTTKRRRQLKLWRM